VVEHVDVVVLLLADVAGLRLDEASRRVPVATGSSSRPWVSSSMRVGAPVAVAEMTALSAERIAFFAVSRRCFLTVLYRRAVARWSAILSGCSGSSSSAASSTRMAAASSAGSIGMWTIISRQAGIGGIALVTAVRALRGVSVASSRCR
jgi:hypothetical protein